jgi:alpha-galactosidase
MHFSAEHLPAGLSLDKASGIISGPAPAVAGSYGVDLQARNARGRTHRRFTIVVGNRIGLTPQMGWNDWYAYYDHVTGQQIRKATDSMVSSGLADYGYQFISIDDTWANQPGSTNPDLSGPPRNAQGTIQANRRFPDMAGLVAYVHSKGLKAGIYSSPGPLTCASFEGSYRHEQQDAEQFARWGFDLLKYDWCSYSTVVQKPGLEDYFAPYRHMGTIVKNLDRDVVLNISQYGLGDAWQWAREAGGNSWRTTLDLGNAKESNLPGFYAIGFANAAHSPYAGPGGWNDPDYILIGKVGDARSMEAPPQNTRLTADEQYSYMSMWSLMAAPLFFSGEITNMDPFTLNVLCNAEVIDIDQDALGRQGRVLRKTDDEFILAKPLEDGSVAVGLFNLSSTPRTLSIRWSDLGLRTSRARVRDVWRQRNLGSFQALFSSPVAAHGVALLKITSR